MRRKKSKDVDSVNIAPRGGKRGPKPRATKGRARDHAEADPLPPVDWMALAIEHFPEPGPMRDACYRDLVSLAEREDALRIECLAGSQVAARAANETIRVRAIRMGWIKTGPKPATKANVGAPHFADLPMFTDAEPEADDVDVNAQLEQSFGTSDDSK